MTDPLQNANAQAPKEKPGFIQGLLKTGEAISPLTQTMFWFSSLLAVLAAGVVIVSGATAGWHGVVLLSGIGGAALLVMFAMMAGDKAGLTFGPKTGHKADALGYAALEAVSEPILITRAGAHPVWANSAYRKLAEQLGQAGDGKVPGPDRLFSGLETGAIYRMTRAAELGQAQDQILGPIGKADKQTHVFRAQLDPLPKGGAIWRFTIARDDIDLSQIDQTPDWADQAPVGIFLADPNGRILGANSTLRDWVGAQVDDPLKIKDLLTDEGAGAFSRARHAEGIVRLEAQLKAKQGVETPVVLAFEWTTGRPKLARGVIYGLSATGAPPGIAQIVEDSGVKPGRTFDDMFAAAPLGVARLDGVDPIVAMIEDSNPAMIQLSGGGAVPGTRFADLFALGEGETLEQVLNTALSDRGEPSEARLKTDPEKDVHVFLAPAKAGKRAAYIVDITAWKGLENQVAQSGKMQAIGQLASSVAHDFNNMLTAIRLNVGELLNRHPVGDPSYQDLQQINSTVTRQAGLVRKLLAFSRKQTFQLTVFDVSDVLSDCSIMLSQILGERVKLETRHGRDLPMVRADRNQIDNILVNLATNARDAMKAQGGGTLTISTESISVDDVRAAGATDPMDCDWAVIHVSDTGHGMDEATQQQIFEPFFTTKATGEGTGLGLATVYGVVKQSGGYLFVESELGKGTTFSIYLPGHIPNQEEVAEIAAEVEAKTAQPQPEDMAGHGRILLVEDEAAVRAIAAKTLVRRGYDVVQACDGEEALEILEDEGESFDLLLSDVVMPGMDGPTMLKQGRKYLKNARVVFISGYAEEEFSDMLSSDLEISFLPKPFDIQQLAERVKKELAVAR